MKYDTSLGKSRVAGFIEEVLRRNGDIVDIFILGLNNPYMKRKNWMIRVDVDEKFDYPGVEWNDLPKCSVSGNRLRVI